MLYIPANSLVNTCKIIGIDPGSETLGLAVIEFDIQSLQIVSTNAQTFIGSKMYSADNWLSTLHSPRVARIGCHKENLINIFRQIDPLEIACESPFYNPRRPNAYGVLVEVLTMIRNAVIEYDPWKSLFLIDPPTVKKSIGAPGNADKNKMMEHMSTLNHLNFSDPRGVSCLDEHSIDALAVAYCRYSNLVKSIY